MDPEPPKPSRFLGASIALLASAILADATGQVADRIQAMTSTLAARPERGEVARLVFWSLMWLGACGTLFRRGWARRLLLVLVAMRGSIVALIFVKILSSGEADTLGFALSAGVCLVYLVFVVVLYRGWTVTPDPPPPIGWRRAAAAAGITASTLIVCALNLLAPEPIDLESLPAGNGELMRLAEHPRWRGERVTVTGMSGRKPVSKPIAPWDLTIQEVGPERVRIAGLYFAQHLSLEVDLARNALIVEGIVFPGA